MSSDHEHDPGCSVGLLTGAAWAVYISGVAIVGAGYWLQMGDLWLSVGAGIGWPLFLPFLVLTFVLEGGM